ncbi:hypothetical protein NLJ89_g12237 [Agrocybe chaxingu]|uniref:Uncharacterized protein n=1 Tax=Agrocybe chaxingu TaxID=84603 RepID=A0A9W8MP95_9AGAR|nr:hypothetical protein NLJ89_g12237 [Agrocybe chaxingu]
MYDNKPSAAAALATLLSAPPSKDERDALAAIVALDPLSSGHAVDAEERDSATIDDADKEDARAAAAAFDSDNGEDAFDAEQAIAALSGSDGEQYSDEDKADEDRSDDAEGELNDDSDVEMAFEAGALAPRPTRQFTVAFFKDFPDDMLH